VRVFGDVDSVGPGLRNNGGQCRRSQNRLRQRRQGDRAGPRDRRDKERELLALKRDLRRATQEFREDYNMRRNEELASLQKIVQQVIVEIAKQENYDLIIHEGTVYASSSVDITAKVLEKLSKRAAQK
jgi:outer membrane protein